MIVKCTHTAFEKYELTNTLGLDIYHISTARIFFEVLNLKYQRSRERK